MDFLENNKSILYFLLGCIPIRILIAVLPNIIDKTYLFYYSFVLLSLAIGFLYLYFNNLRLNAFEAGGNTWWSEYRLIHGMLYLIAAIYAYQMKSIAGIPLTIDVIFGFILFINHHYIKY
jgi:hypothetical protein